MPSFDSSTEPLHLVRIRLEQTLTHLLTIGAHEPDTSPLSDEIRLFARRAFTLAGDIEHQADVCATQIRRAARPALQPHVTAAEELIRGDVIGIGGPLAGLHEISTVTYRSDSSGEQRVGLLFTDGSTLDLASTTIVAVVGNSDRDALRAAGFAVDDEPVDTLGRF